MASLDEIKALLESQSQSVYNPANVAKLEQYVSDQVAGTAPYYFDANRVLVKLYSFYPEQFNESITAQILLLSLLEFPSTDLVALLCLVPSPTGESTATIIRYVWKMERAMEGCVEGSYSYLFLFCVSHVCRFAHSHF